MLYPKEFLRELDQQRNRTTYARITTLTFDERPLEEIEGRITSGSLNMDGSSAVRRTCQLSVVQDDINISNYNWSLNTKFKLSIGLANYVNSAYPDIIWFDQGIYLITSFSTAYSATSYTINISGKDKMCLLNGEIGGSIGSSVDFGTIEIEREKDVWEKVKLPVKDIIRDMVHTYGGEPYHNIIISNLDETGLILQEYRYDKPMYLLRPIDSNQYTQGFIDANTTVSWNGVPCSLTALESQPTFIFETMADNFLETTPSEVGWGQGGRKYYVAKIDYGETAGYTETELVYPQDLIANVGESVTSILDKIKTFLGDFEYFYNLDGQFVFQKKREYISTNWSPLESDTYVKDLNNVDKYAYSFSDSEFFTSFNNTPQIANVRNDFCVWGESGQNKTPIHMRYAIDSKPMAYRTIHIDDNDSELVKYNQEYNLQTPGQSSMLYVVPEAVTSLGLQIVPNPTGQEAYYNAETGILQLYTIPGALDSNTSNLFLGRPAQYNNPGTFVTTYASQYVVCDWREIIYRMALDYNRYNRLDSFEKRVADANKDLDSYVTGRTGYEQYYIDLEGFWRQLYNLEPTPEEADLYYTNSNDARYGWAKMVYDEPEKLKFWFDFLDGTGELQQFSVPAIGARPKVKNDKDVRAIHYKTTPNVIFIEGGTTMPVEQKPGYHYFTYPAGLTLFTKSAQGKSAKEEIDSLLYNHGYCSESVSISSVPIYHLDVNTRVYINDAESGINGDYIISKISMPLSYNGTMNITATKAVEYFL